MAKVKIVRILQKIITFLNRGMKNCKLSSSGKYEFIYELSIYWTRQEIYNGLKQIYKHFIYGNDFFSWVAAIS